MMHDIDALKRKIDSLDRSLLSLESLVGVLGGIIHKPGWTTVAEFALVDASIDAMQRHVEAVADHYKRLVTAARWVGGG